MGQGLLAVRFSLLDMFSHVTRSAGGTTSYTRAPEQFSHGRFWNTVLPTRPTEGAASRSASGAHSLSPRSLTDEP